MIRFKHSGQLGDIVYSLPAMLDIAHHLGDNRFTLYVPSDQKANHAPGLNHISGDLMITQPMFDFIKPLLMHQPYIEAVHYLPVAAIPPDVVDMDLIRGGNMNLAAGNIKNYYFKYFGLVSDDPQPWLHRSPEPSLGIFDIIIGRSTRYLNDAIDYSVLNDYTDSVGFIGTHNELLSFQSRYPYAKINTVPIGNALEACSVIATCGVYIGNQSLFFAIAEGLGTDRALESFEPVPNVISSGGRSGHFIGTSGLRSILDIFFDRSIGLPEADTSPQRWLLSR